MVEGRPTKRIRLEDGKKICRIFYDCETSGQGCAHYVQPRIIELAAVSEYAEGTWDFSRSSRKVEGYFGELIAGGPCTAAATRIHGIRDEDLQHSRAFVDVWTGFVAFAHRVQTLHKDVAQLCLVGHSAISNDNYWLLTELKRCNRSIEELALPGVKLVFEDTCPILAIRHRMLKRHLGTHNLQNSTIHKALYPDAPHGQVHSALWDASATRDNWFASQILRECSTLITLEEQLYRWAKCVQRRQTMRSIVLAVRENAPRIADSHS